jgi:hypothetical protein
VGAGVGVGAEVGACVGAGVGAGEGTGVGAEVGAAVKGFPLLVETQPPSVQTHSVPPPFSTPLTVGRLGWDVLGATAARQVAGAGPVALGGRRVEVQGILCCDAVVAPLDAAAACR